MSRLGFRLGQPLFHWHPAGSGLWVAKLYYLCFWAALGALAPFFNLYLQQRGLSGTQIGLIGSIPPLIALAANPFWGAVADRWHIHKQVMALCVFVGGLLAFPFIWLHSFGPILFVVVLMVFFRAPVPALLDSATMTIVARAGASYGRQRLFGSIGFVAFSFGLGQLLSPQRLDIIFVVHGLLLMIGCTLLSLLLPLQQRFEPGNLLAGLRELARNVAI